MPSPRRVPQDKPVSVASCDELCSPPVFLFELLARWLWLLLGSVPGWYSRPDKLSSAPVIITTR
jgi:hypothetical protein